MFRITTLLLALPLVLVGTADTASAGGTPFGGDCESSCTVGCDGCCGESCRPCRWRHLCTWIGPGCFCTTGMMFPHHPYLPECHGHYDFAPYTALRLEEHRVLAPTLGEPPENPYARNPFADVYANLPNTDYPSDLGIGSVPQLPRVAPLLPDVEALLEARSQAPPAPAFPGIPE